MFLRHDGKGSMMVFLAEVSIVKEEQQTTKTSIK